MKRLFTISFLLLSIGCRAQFTEAALFVPVVSGGGLGGFTWHVNLTFDHTQVAAVDNYTFIINLTDASLKTTGNGGAINNTGTVNGETVPYDLGLFSDAGFTTPLTGWAVKKYDGSTSGKVVIYVLVPSASVSTSTDFTIYMGYGKSSWNTFQGGSIGAAFDANVVGAWPLGNGTTLNLNDFSSGGNNGTAFNTPTATAGVNGGAANFASASNQYIDNGTSTTLAPIAITVFCLFNATTLPTGYQTFAGRAGGGWELLNHNLSNLAYYGNGASGTFSYDPGSTTLSTSTWYVTSFNYSSATGIIGYLNSSVDGTGLNRGNIVAGSGNHMVIGAESSGFRNFNGSVSDIIVSNISRSANWVTTMTNAFKNSSTLISYGTKY